MPEAACVSPPLMPAGQRSRFRFCRGNGVHPQGGRVASQKRAYNTQPEPLRATDTWPEPDQCPRSEPRWLPALPPCPRGKAAQCWGQNQEPRKAPRWARWCRPWPWPARHQAPQQAQVWAEAAASPSTPTLAKRHAARVGFTRQGLPSPPNAWALHPKAQCTDAVHTGGT